MLNEEHVILMGNNQIGENVVIKPFCIIINSTISDNSVIEEFSYIENSTICGSLIGKHSTIENSDLECHCQIHDYCKVKNAIVKKGTVLDDYSQVIYPQQEKKIIGENVQVGQYIRLNQAVEGFSLVKENHALLFLKD